MRTKVRRVGLQLVLLAVVTLTALGATRAQASEQAPHRDVPNLALIVQGGTERTVALHSGERDFARLWQLLAPMYTGTERVPDAWVAGRFPQVRATIVWGLTGVGGWPGTHRAPGGDIAIERQDQVFLAADGTPWVRTDPSPDLEDDDIRWHRAPRAAFADVANRGDLLGSGSDSAAAGTRDLADRAGWAVPGLAAGLALGAGGTLVIRRAAARREVAGPPREPRQELIDL
jgi:hypothetical protein